MDGKDPYIPVTVLNIKNQTDFSKISNLISNTYDFQSATKEDNQTQNIRKQLISMTGSYDKYQNKLKSNPFGVFGGSPKERVYAPQFDMPYKKIADSKPLIELLRAKVNKTPLKLP